MSNLRRQKERGFVRGEIAKGPNGRNLCRRCRAEVPKGRMTFCSKECVHEWRIRTDPGYVRDQVYMRDKGLCAMCGLDVFDGAVWRSGRQRPRSSRLSGDLWQADHIVPVIEGGGECSLEGYRTLCTACHKNETAKLRRRMAWKSEPVAVKLKQTVIL